mmetsp:Transcript_25934/g.22874  ORF Transcript_25934/g.22874 Transcript_25934/m.22874 type:complete len:316 (+) Transcript_25934:339-1286(+)|eukprot:CAMPEP_0114588536 /NCGR_PEP_ID=MMETSP0125-20121206/11212_1 /TAXON_ID=485358 ORGANISM="Aristerostoma sp., Strain ATCC 50986" /NCGR_SAMPLE_ID=MMETSP0125 /ASSEMBLY_ACC=CAM_ASM_000245 /LENGTH=315 /DNA_ID=CAMNT_0001784977 /DNA_START=263 /DNA_END=1210 /DNA_ORIENTATION=+
MMSAYAGAQGIYNGTGPGLNNTFLTDIAVPPFEDEDLIKNITNDLTLEAAIPNNFQPISIHSQKTQDDSALASYSSCFCPQSPNWIASNSQDAPSMSTFNLLNVTTAELAKLDINLTTISDYQKLGDVCIADYFNDFELPGKIDTTSDTYKDIKFAYEWYQTHVYTAQSFQKSIYNYNLTNTILNNIKAYSTSERFTNPYVYLYYSDEPSLISLLNAFGVLNDSCLANQWQGSSTYELCVYPHFGSNIILEYYINGSSPYLKAFYNGTSLNLCGNTEDSSICTLDQFSSLVSGISGSYNTDSIQSKCGIDTDKDI